MENQEIKVGDIVILKSNPEIKMTVESILPQGNFDIVGGFTGYRNSELIRCSWFDKNGEIKRDNFHREALLKGK